MQRWLRGWILCGLVIGIGVIAFADNKPIPELITNATKEAIPSFRLAAARALVPAELVTGKTMAFSSALPPDMASVLAALRSVSQAAT